MLINTAAKPVTLKFVKVFKRYPSARHYLLGMKEKTQLNWQTLPMELMSEFTDCHQWVVMERLWFKSNHGDNVSLNYLNLTTPIKSRPVILETLNGLVERGWITKTPYGKERSGRTKNGKAFKMTPHKYTLNKLAFTEWMGQVLSKTCHTGSNPNLNRFQSEPEQVLIKTDLGSNQNHIDNRDNLIDNKKAKAVLVPVTVSPETEAVLVKLKEKKLSESPDAKLKEEQDFQEIRVKLFEQCKLEEIKRVNLSGFQPSDQTIWGLVNKKLKLGYNKRK